MKWEDVHWIGESKYNDVYDMIDYIMHGVYLGKITYEQAIDIIHDIIAEKKPDGYCANNQPKEDENV